MKSFLSEMWSGFWELRKDEPWLFWCLSLFLVGSLLFFGGVGLELATMRVVSTERVTVVGSSYTPGSSSVTPIVSSDGKMHYAYSSTAEQWTVLVRFPDGRVHAADASISVRAALPGTEAVYVYRKGCLGILRDGYVTAP